MRKTIGFAVVAVALAAAPALAQTTSPTGQTTNPASGQTATHQSTKPKGPKQATRGTAGSLSAADLAFAKEAARGGLAEVDLGNMTKDKASNDDVKQFGDRMVTDHSKANDELKSLAEQKNVTLPSALDAKAKATQTRLSKLSGAAYDKAYMRDMVSDHEHDVAAFRKEARSGKDPDLKAFASKTLPTLEEHLKLAKETAAKVGVGSKTKNPKAKGK